MDYCPVNVLLTTFAGLRLPRTLTFASNSNAPVQDVLEAVHQRLPRGDHAYIITTTSNKQLNDIREAKVSSLLSCSEDDFLPLRLSVKVCGGKGGFGSQLRAAGGRMSSRKKRNQNEPQNGSNRNLDGRRLRTVGAAKALAEFYANKPKMEEEARKTRREQLEDTVRMVDQKEDEIKSGKSGANRGRLDAEYVESKELAEERTREAVIKAMRSEMLENARTGSESSEEAKASDSTEEDRAASDSSAEHVERVAVVETATPADRGISLYGFEDDDEDSESDNEHTVLTAEEPVVVYEGKGKGKIM